MPKDNSDIHEELENSAFDEKEANVFDLYAEDTVPDSFQNTNSINGFRGLFGLNRAII